MGFLQRVDGLAGPERVVWQPGWQSAEDLRTEWFERNGWLGTPPAAERAHWDAVRRAEEEFHRATERDSGAIAGSGGCTVGSDVAAILFIAAHPGVGDRAGYVAVELFELPTGQPVVFGFTSLAGLVAACGEHQPWLRLPGAVLMGLGDGILLVDPDPGVVEAIWTAERLQALVEAVDA